MLFALVAFIAYWALLKSNNKSSLTIDQTRIAVTDTASIDKIYIARLDGSRHTFTRRLPGGMWIMDGKYLADPTRMFLIMEALHDVDFKRPVSQKEFNRVVKQIAAENIKVEVYLKGKLFRTFYLGNETDGNTGNYTILDKSDEPFVAYLRGFNGYLQPRFYIDKPLKWRWQRLFNSTPNTLQSIKVAYPNRPTQSFEVAYGNLNFIVKNMPNADSLKLMDYVLQYQQGAVEMYLDTTETRWNNVQDSLISQVDPMCIIEVEDVRPRWRKKLEIYAYPSGDHTRRFMAVIYPGRELVTLQVANFEKFLVPKAYFEQ